MKTRVHGNVKTRVHGDEGQLFALLISGLSSPGESWVSVGPGSLHCGYSVPDNNKDIAHTHLTTKPGQTLRALHVAKVTLLPSRSSGGNNGITWTPGSSSSSGAGDGGGVLSKSEFSEPSVFPLLTFFFKALASESGFLLLEFKAHQSVFISVWFPKAPNLLFPLIWHCGEG